MADFISFNDGGEASTAQNKPLAPSSNPEQRLPTPAPTSCRRCRKHKLRCSKDLPICKRCRDAKTICDYPPPPNRKLLAAQRVQRAKLQRSTESGGNQQTSRNPSQDSDQLTIRKLSSTGRLSHSSASVLNPGSNDSHLDIEDQPTSTPFPNSVLKRTTLPSPEVSSFLFEVYFSRVYNASLLFHKKSFLADYAASLVPDFVSLSIFALASIFLGSSTEKLGGTQDEDEIDHGLLILSKMDAEKQGGDWATAASQRVLMQADIPRLETVQACQNLALYWFSRGQTDRTHIHTHTAYRVARLLKLHLQHPILIDPNNHSWSEEHKRRCFWSCWTTGCISQENAVFKSKPWEAVIGLCFPSDEMSYALGAFVRTGNFNNNGKVVLIEAKSSAPPSTMGELVKLCDLWWQIHDLIRHCGETTPSSLEERTSQFWELDQRLESIQDNMHPAFKYESAASFRSPENNPYDLFFIQALCRTCSCILHSSVVPLFSELPSASLLPKKAIRLAVEECVKNATFVLDMASGFLSIRPDLSRLPSLVGYAMFVASTVYFKTIVVQRRIQERTISRLKAAIYILESSKGYWFTNQALWESLQKLFASKTIDINSICSIKARANVGSEHQDIDLEGIMSHKETPQEKERTGTDIYTYVKLQEDAGCSPSRVPQRKPTSRSTQTQPSSPSVGAMPFEAAEQNSQQTQSSRKKDGFFPHNPNPAAFTPPYEEQNSPTPMQSMHGQEQLGNRFPESHGNDNVTGMSLDEISQALRADNNPIARHMENFRDTGSNVTLRPTQDFDSGNPGGPPDLAMEFGEEMTFRWDQTWQAFQSDLNGLSAPMETNGYLYDFPYNYMI